MNLPVADTRGGEREAGSFPSIIASTLSISLAPLRDRPLSTDNRPLSTDIRLLSTDNRVLAADNHPLSTDNRVLAADILPLSTDNHLLSTDICPLATDNRALSTDNHPLSTDNRALATDWVAVSARGCHLWRSYYGVDVARLNDLSGCWEPLYLVVREGLRAPKSIEAWFMHLEQKEGGGRTRKRAYR